MALTDQVIMPGSDYQAICDATRSLTSTTGTLKSGEVADRILEGKKTTYFLKEDLIFPEASTTYHLNFINNKGTYYNYIFVDTSDSISKKVYYKTNTTSDYIYNDNNGWIDDGIVFDSEKRNRIITVIGNITDPSALSWLHSNIDMVLESGEISLSKVTASAISVEDTTGKISCTFNVSKGITGSVGISPTKQLPTQAGKTVTPSLSKQTVAPAGVFLLGQVDVSPVPTETKTVALNMASGSQIIRSTSGKYMTQVTVEKPSTLIPHNIKKGVEIGGITGKYDGDSVFIKDVDTITSTTSEGVITFNSPRLARYLCVRSGTSYIASADIRSISSYYTNYTIGDFENLSITKTGTVYKYTWHLFSSNDPKYDGSIMKINVIA